jgi:hypothetical protein
VVPRFRGRHIQEIPRSILGRRRSEDGFCSVEEAEGSHVDRSTSSRRQLAFVHIGRAIMRTHRGDRLCQRVVIASGRYAADPSDVQGLSVFLFPDRGEAPLRGDLLCRNLAIKGFDLLRLYPLSIQQRTAVCSIVTPIAGELTPNDIAYMAVALNLNAVPPTETQRRWVPSLSDRRLPWALSAVGRARRADLPVESSGSTRPVPIYAVASSSLSLRCLEAVVPEEVASLRELIADQWQQYSSPFSVLSTLGGEGVNARVELVRHCNRLAVCKVFRPGRRAMLERELTARTELARDIVEMPELIESGDHWLLTPYYENTMNYRSDMPWLMPVCNARTLIEFLQKLYEHGFAHLDCHPGNLIIEPSGAARVVDFEYLHRYTERPASFEQSYDIIGPPAGFTGDLPGGKRLTYATALKPAVGLDLRSLRSGSHRTQQRKRVQYLLSTSIPRSLGRWALRKTRLGLGAEARMLRRQLLVARHERVQARS